MQILLFALIGCALIGSLLITYRAGEKNASRIRNIRLSRDYVFRGTTSTGLLALSEWKKYGALPEKLYKNPGIDAGQLETDHVYYFDIDGGTIIFRQFVPSEIMASAGHKNMQ